MSQAPTISQPVTLVFGIGTDVWGGWIRHGITAAAGILAEHGILMSSTVSAEAMQLGVAGVMSGLTLAWSWWQKRQQRKV